MAQGSLVLVNPDQSEEIVLEAPMEVIATVHNFYKHLSEDETLQVNVMDTWYRGRTYLLSKNDEYRFEYRPYWHETAPLRRDYAEMLRLDSNQEFRSKGSISFDTWRHGIWIPFAGPAEHVTQYDRFWGTD